MSAVTKATQEVPELPDLSQCAQEPIHTPGFIEPHGVLLVLDEPALCFVQVSANTKTLLGRSADLLLGQRLDTVLTEITFLRLTSEVLVQDLEAKPHYLSEVRVRDCGTLFEGLIHRYQGLLLLELEPALPSSSGVPADLPTTLMNAMTRLQSVASPIILCQNVARLVRQFTGFDRVMVYQFLEDESGKVVAEDKQEKLSPYLGLHYPASDIPAQARRLYLLNTLRLKPDVNAAKVPLIPAINPTTNQPLDMTHCVLRSMSPIHDEYLRNMGVCASMSISIVKADRL
jgi:two-component system, chemotaxis family, sensor kinase Cph1